MAAFEVKRDYSMSDAELIQTSDILAVNVTRDMTDFGTRGVDASTVTNLETLTSTFVACPMDSELLGDVMVATEAKDALKDQLIASIRSIRNMAEIKFKNSGKYASFGFKDMNRMPDRELMLLGRKVARLGTKFLADLASEGLTAPKITALTNLAIAFDDSLEDQQDAIETRDLATQDRIEKGNILYAEVVRLCSIGQTLYFDTNPAKYNDYIIYGSSGSTLSLRGHVQTQETHEPIANAIIEIMNTGIIKNSNSEGLFEVYRLAPGIYDVQVTHPNYQPASMPVTIESGVVTDITVVMVPV